MKIIEALKDQTIASLQDMKAVDVVVLDVKEKSTIADYMIVASGTSARHVKAVANGVVVAAKKAGHTPLGIEGDKEGEWVLVDLGDVIVHVMMPAVRDFYQLEKLWEAGSVEEMAVIKPRS